MITDSILVRMEEGPVNGQHMAIRPADKELICFTIDSIHDTVYKEHRYVRYGLFMVHDGFIEKPIDNPLKEGEE